VSVETRVNEIAFGDLGRETRASEEITSSDVNAPSQVITKPDSVTLSKDIQPLITAEPDTAPATISGESEHLVLDIARIAFGVTHSDGIGVVGSGTTTSIVLGTGEGANWQAGMCGFVKSTAATGSYPMMFRVKEVTSDTLALSWAMPAAPLVGGTVLGTSGAYKGAPAADTLALLWEGENLDHSVRAKLGKPAAFSIDCQPRQIPKMSATISAAGIDDPVFDTDHGGIAEVVDAFPFPLQTQGGGYQVVPLTVSTQVHGTPILALGVAKLDLGIIQSLIYGVWGNVPNGVASHCISRRNVTVEAKLCFANYAVGGTPAAGEGAYFYSAYKSGAQFGLMFWWGSWPSMIGFCVPAAQITAAPAPEDQEGRAVLPLTFEERSYTGDDTGATTSNCGACLVFADGTVAP
jgi:hypothetical protein